MRTPHRKLRLFLITFMYDHCVILKGDETSSAKFLASDWCINFQNLFHSYHCDLCCIVILLSKTDKLLFFLLIFMLFCHVNIAMTLISFCLYPYGISPRHCLTHKSIILSPKSMFYWNGLSRVIRVKNRLIVYDVVCNTYPRSSLSFTQISAKWALLF